MEPLNSGNQDEREHLVCRYLPALAITAVAIPLLYLVLSMSAAQSGMFFFEWLGFLLLAAFILHWLLAQQDRVLIFLGISINIVLPFLVVLIGFRLRNDQLMLHGMAIVLLNALAWVPGLIVLEAAGGALRQMQRRPATTRKGASFSRMFIILVMLAGTMVFMQGEFAASGSESMPNPLLFALPFYLVVWTLLSLAKLVQKVFETPRQPIILSGNLITHWLALMLVVLLLSAGLAFLLPKHPIGTLLGSSPQDYTATPPPLPPPLIVHIASHPVDLPPPADSNPQAMHHDYAPLHTPPATVNRATTPPSRRQNAPLGNVQSTNFPNTSPTQSPGQSPPGDNQQTGGAQGATGAISPTPSQTPGSGQNGTSGEENTADNPDASSTSPPPEDNTHLLLVSAGLLLIALLLLFLAWRLKWLHRLGRALRKLYAAYRHRFHPSQGTNNREQLVAELMREYDPFVDPLLAPGDRSPRQLVSAVYQTFLAYLALLKIGAQGGANGV